MDEDILTGLTFIWNFFLSLACRLTDSLFHSESANAMQTSPELKFVTEKEISGHVKAGLE
jgi:hypothetical protein